MEWHVRHGRLARARRSVMMVVPILTKISRSRRDDLPDHSRASREARQKMAKR
jgi:hypothetical protein